jgi:hypothetical protein
MSDDPKMVTINSEKLLFKDNLILTAPFGKLQKTPEEIMRCFLVCINII